MTAPRRGSKAPASRLRCGRVSRSTNTPVFHPTSTDISVNRQVVTEFLPMANKHKEKMVNIISYQGNAN